MEILSVDPLIPNVATPAQRKGRTRDPATSASLSAVACLDVAHKENVDEEYFISIGSDRKCKVAA